MDQIEALKNLKPPYVRMGAYLVLEEALNLVLHGATGEISADNTIQVHSISINEDFFDDHLKPALWRIHGKLVVLIMDYNGLYTMADLRDVLLALIDMSAFVIQDTERTYVHKHWTESRLIYGKDPLCKKRHPFLGDNRERLDPVSNEGRRVERKEQR